MSDESPDPVEGMFASLAVCRICSEFIGPMIFQCLSGHWFCETCARKLDTCPTCRGSIPRGGIRARSLEEVLRVAPSLPCVQEGCDLKLPFDDMVTHYYSCPYREVVCPLETCGWSGNADSIHEHVNEAHCDVIQDVPEDVRIIVRNVEGHPIQAGVETIVRIPSGKLFLIGAYILRGQPVPSSLVTCVMYLGVLTGADPLTVTARVSSKIDTVELACSRKPWHILDRLSEARQSRRNLIIDIDLALRLGIDPPVFRANDQLRKTPLHDGMRLPIDISFDEDPVADSRYILGRRELPMCLDQFTSDD